VLFGCNFLFFIFKLYLLERYGMRNVVDEVKSVILQHMVEETATPYMSF
jgi:hypothetical protein